MVFKDNLYIITSEDIDNGLFNIRLKDDCFIYAAHFPNFPITPGVCVIQIVKELAEILFNQTLTLKSIKNAKFLKVMQPNGDKYTRQYWDKVPPCIVASTERRFCFFSHCALRFS